MLHRGDRFWLTSYYETDLCLPDVVGAKVLFVYNALRSFVWRSSVKGNDLARRIASEKKWLVAIVGQRKLGERLGVTRQTVASCLKQLAAYGWIRPIPGDGLKSITSYALGEVMENEQGARVEITWRDRWIAMTGWTLDQVAMQLSGNPEKNLTALPISYVKAYVSASLHGKALPPPPNELNQVDESPAGQDAQVQEVNAMLEETVRKNKERWAALGVPDDKVLFAGAMDDLVELDTESGVVPARRVRSHNMDARLVNSSDASLLNLEGSIIKEGKSHFKESGRQKDLGAIAPEGRPGEQGIFRNGCAAGVQTVGEGEIPLLEPEAETVQTVKPVEAVAATSESVERPVMQDARPLPQTPQDTPSAPPSPPRAQDDPFGPPDDAPPVGSRHNQLDLGFGDGVVFSPTPKVAKRPSSSPKEVSKKEPKKEPKTGVLAIEKAWQEELRQLYPEVVVPAFGAKERGQFAQLERAFGGGEAATRIVVLGVRYAAQNWNLLKNKRFRYLGSLCVDVFIRHGKLLCTEAQRWGNAAVALEEERRWLEETEGGLLEAMPEGLSARARDAKQVFEALGLASGS